MTRLFRLIVLLATAMVAGVSHAELLGIDNQKFQSLIDEGVPVIDVRRLDEWEATGVVQGSQLMTFFDKEGRYDAPGWFSEFSAAVDTNQPFVLICHSGTRTSIIGKWLGKQLETVYHVENGIAGWLKESRPVVALPR